MTVRPCPVAVLLVELARRGIELRAAGDRLRYRPRSAMTPDLADRLRIHRGDLLAILAAADVASVKSAARDGAARLIRDARRCGGIGQAIALRDAWQERLAICTIDGDLQLHDAEMVALDEMNCILADRQG